MQTFLPYQNFADSAAVIDRMRLGKQRPEVYQILRALDDPYYGWQNHPAVKMWRGYEQALVRYGVAICTEWIGRGYVDQTLEKILEFENKNIEIDLPWWFGNEDFHRSHRSKLLQKDPEWYGKYFDEPMDLEYIWPTKHLEKV